MDIEKDYYAILDISPTALDEEIRLAYRKLARQYQPEADSNAGTNELFEEIQEAYELLNDPAKRKKYDHWRSKKGFDRSSALSLHMIASHDSLVSLPQEQAFYVLLSVMPAASLPTMRLPVNLCLVIDRSTSMQGIRLQQVKEAIHRIIDKLRPEDFLSLVVFSDRAKVLLPSERHIDPARAKAIASTIQASGGTEILQGLLAGLKELKHNQSETSVNHLILLTDGQTYGDEQECLEQAEWAGANQVQLSTIGIGTDWNEKLLDQMADLSGGTSSYIDAPEKITNIFTKTLNNLETVVARELKVRVNANPNVYLHEAYQTTPHIYKLDVKKQEVTLGALSVHQEKSLLMEFWLKDFSLGEHWLMRLTVDADMPGESNRSWEWLELRARFVEQPNPEAKIPSQITTALSKIAVYRMQQKVADYVKAGDIKKATQHLQLISTRLFELGEPELSQAALFEAGQLTQTGLLSPAGRKQIHYGTRALIAGNTTKFSTKLIS